MGEGDRKKKNVKQMCSANLTLLKSNTSENTIPSEKVVVFMLWGCFYQQRPGFVLKQNYEWMIQNIELYRKR